MIVLKTLSDIKKLYYSNQIVAKILEILINKTIPGVTTKELNNLAEKLTKELGARPAFKGYEGFPYSLCASVNEQVVHGFPNETKLKNGDILSMDFGVEYDGFYGDSAVTVPVGKISKAASKLIEVTEKSLYIGINAFVVGNKIADISAAIQNYVEGSGMGVVREFAGHGIGKNLHEEPQVLNYVDLALKCDTVIKPGMTIAIEPMVTLGNHEVVTGKDKWTTTTVDKSLSAHFEHTVVATVEGPIILSKRRS